MEGLSEVLLKGGPVALILAGAVALKYIAEGLLAWRRSTREGGPTPHVASPTDAATTNAMLLDSLRQERAESARKDSRIDELTAENDELHTQIYDQRRTYEHEISQLRSKLQDISLQLEALQQRIAAGLPVPPHASA